MVMALCKMYSKRLVQNNTHFNNVFSFFFFFFKKMLADSRHLNATALTILIFKWLTQQLHICKQCYGNKQPQKKTI